MAISKEERLARIHSEALREFDKVQQALRAERLQCLQDRRFATIAGAQWEGAIADQFANKPKFEFNKVHLSIIRIENEWRNNRITVDFVSKEGDEYDQLAETCDDLYRADEQSSVADEAYDNAFSEGITGGFGAFRLRACYEDEDDDENDDQRVRIEPIFDADSCVWFDLDAKRQDKSDAKRCWVLTPMTIDAFMAEWPDAPVSMPKEITQIEFDWYAPDQVYVAEYYVVEHVKETILIFKDLQGEEVRYSQSEFDEDPDLAEYLANIGTKKVGEKKAKKRRVHKYIMSGAKILEDCGFIAGKEIPIVPFYGKRWVIDGIERCMGHVRLAKDPQIIKNIQLSRLGEIAAMSPIRKPIFTPEQMAGNATLWAEDNVKNNPYLLINEITDAMGNKTLAGPVGYTEPPDIPQALAALMAQTEADLKEIMGNQQAADAMVSNVSGKAVEMIQQRLDMMSFIYISNFAKSMKRSGEIWLSMAKDIMNREGRKIKGIGKDGTTKQIEIMRPVYDPESKETKFENDLSEAACDVVATVGPSSDSKKQATVRSLTGMLAVTDDPETKQVLGSMIMMNMEGEGIGEVRDFFRKRLVRMGAIKPTDEEKQELMAEAQNSQPDAQTQYLQQAANKESALAQKAQADTALTIAKKQETEANTLKTLSEVSAAEFQQAQANLQQNPVSAQPV